MKQHFLQSKAWEDFQKLEGDQTFRLDHPRFSALAILKTTPVGNYLFCPYGPTLASDQPDQLKHDFELALADLKSLAREQNAIFVRLEPTFPVDTENSPLTASDFEKLGLKKSHDLEPAHTWVIDLTQPEADILKQMRGSNVQYWRSHAKKGLIIRQTQDPEKITILSSLLRGVANKDHFTPQDETHLKNQLKSGFATLYIAELDGEALAASLVYDSDDSRFYAHAATSDTNRKIAAGTVLLVQMILDAKSKGQKTFDFWGITTSEDKSHPWYGFTQYKKSFGGKMLTYAGTWDLPVNANSYRLYNLIRHLNRFKRKFIK